MTFQVFSFHAILEEQNLQYQSLPSKNNQILIFVLATINCLAVTEWQFFQGFFAFPLPDHLKYLFSVCWFPKLRWSYII